MAKRPVDVALDFSLREGEDEASGGAGGVGDPGSGGATSATTPATGMGGAFGTTSAGGGEPFGVPEVFGHSSSTLYRLDPETKAVGVVAPFSGCSGIYDIALDEQSNLYGTTSTSLYQIDRATAECTLIASGSYPNSLSFVPKGTLDPNVEALVGYVEDQYVRIDTTTGQVTNIGAPWNNNFISSGDIVSVKNGPTFLTIKDKPGGGGVCADCLVEINPATGAIIKTYPNLGYDKVFGTAFWAGKVYGFTSEGELFEVVINGNTLTTVAIPTQPGLSFWGAGSTTAAPPVPQ